SVAVAGGVGRAGLQAGGGAVGEDARDGVAAAVVVAEDLAQEAPDGGRWAEQPVAIPDAVLVEDFQDAGFGQGAGEGQSLVARDVGADLLQGGHGGSRVSGCRWGGPGSAAAGPGEGGAGRNRLPGSLYAAGTDPMLRLQLLQGLALVPNLATFIDHT